ncbi:MmcQ/YjbR family DNA-binding protein, partial [Enterobacter genomosp. O]|uniref:MmcQ/YjbR family DNA-binding protein n=1 Tax=Enterobacter genomosp. O TaxID=2364150 RepID=UPI00325BE032
PEFDVFKVGGKIFMIVAVAHGRPHVSLKSDPEKSLLNQQIYRGIEPGYHLSKKHWISLYGTDVRPPVRDRHNHENFPAHFKHVKFRPKRPAVFGERQLQGHAHGVLL